MTTELARFATRRAAESERKRFVAAQELVDRVSDRLFGVPMWPPADAVYQVIVVDRKYVLVYEDPSVGVDE